MQRYTLFRVFTNFVKFFLIKKAVFSRVKPVFNGYMVGLLIEVLPPFRTKEKAHIRWRMRAFSDGICALGVILLR